jgi:hypothetical protein
MELEDEAGGLLHRLMRLRVALRFANDSRAEAILREVIANIEERLVALERAGAKAASGRTKSPAKSD